MLRFERKVVAALGSAPDQPTQSAVEAFVDGSLRAMPETIRLGVAGETVLFGMYARIRGTSGPDEVRALLDRWGASRISVVRQYVHMFHSLVLFAENELADLEGGSRTDPEPPAGHEVDSGPTPPGPRASVEVV